MWAKLNGIPPEGSCQVTVMSFTGGRPGAPPPQTGVVADQVPRAIDFQEDETWRAIAERGVEVFEGLVLVAKLRVGAREVQR